MPSARADSDPFVLQLAELCSTHRTRAKWVFVPTHAIGRTLGDRLVLAGTDWANLRFVTPLDIALRMGAPFLVERGIDPSEEGLGPALIMRLLLALPEHPAYFRPLAGHPTMAQALWRTLRELRMGGLSPDDLPATAFASAAKHAELRSLYTAYLQFLATNARGDMATLYLEALQHPDWCPIQSADCVTEWPGALWTPLQRRLLDAMPGERIAPRSLDIAGVAVPRRMSKTVERVAPGESSPLAFLLSPESRAAAPAVAVAHSTSTSTTTSKGKGRPKAATAAPTLFALAAPAVHLFHAGGREAEVEEVFRRIVASGCPVDQVEIACANSEYVPLIWEKACRYEWPVTMATGLPATLTRPGRALVERGAWIDSDFAAGVLRRLLQSGDATLGDIDLAPGQAASVLVKAEAAWGRKTYELSLGRLSKSNRARAGDTELADEHRAAAAVRADRADQLLVWIRGLLAGVPEPDADDRIDLQQLVDGTLQFIDACAATSSALDGAAKAALSDAVTELRGLGAFRCTLAEGLRFVHERVDGVHVGADRPRPGHLYMSQLSQVGLPGRAQVFVVGLEEGRVFPAAVEDPVLLDVERERISPLLRRSSDRIEEAVYAVVSRLAATGDATEVCFSYSCRDLREFRQTYPSWLLLQAHRIVTGRPEAGYQDLLDALGAPVSCVPEPASVALGEAGWWLHGLKRMGEGGRPAVLRRYPLLKQGVRADEQRESGAFTEYDGFVPEAGPMLDPCARQDPVSATQLEGAAGCAFRHFLSRGLGLHAVDDGQREMDVWLAPMLRGSLLHDLYAQLMRRGRDAKRRVSKKADLQWFLERGRLALEGLRVEMPPPSDEVFEREQQELLGDLELFIDGEEDGAATRTPLAFEVSFGRPDDGEEPLATAEPIDISLGKGLTFRLAGRIDRIDQIGPDSFEIVDYKTGSYFDKDYAGVFGGGTKLQHALYGLAAVEILKGRVKGAKVARGIYYFSSSRGRQERRVIEQPSLGKITEVLGDLREVIASGLFVHASDDGACKFCDYGAACGGNASVERSAVKREADARLAPNGRLASHE